MYYSGEVVAYRDTNLYMHWGHLGHKLGGCNDEVAALHSDHYTVVILYYVISGWIITVHSLSHLK